MMNELGALQVPGVPNGNMMNSGCDSPMSSADSKLCRDFIRNVCHRGKNCKFIHPENVKIRSDPIFCHDFQQNRCHRPSCKFVHCSREIEEHFKKTGDLPENVFDNENGHQSNDNRRSNDRNSRSSNGSSRAGNEQISPDVPVCKDFLKGVCNRPFGACKYKHVNSQGESSRNSPRGGRTQNGSGMKNGGGGGMRRRGSDGLYDPGPEPKKLRPNENPQFPGFPGQPEEFNEDFYVGANGHPQCFMPPHSEPHPQPVQPMPPTSAPETHQFAFAHQNPATSTYAAIATSARNGYSTASTADTTVAAYIHSTETIKALEDENFMLKRRIEELKTSNEFLLNQNAQLRLNSSLSVSRTSVGVENAVQVAPAVGVASVASGVVQTMVSLAQPMGITPALSVAATHNQTLSTISTLPTVSMQPAVSISQALPIVSIAQHAAPPQPAVYPMVTTQGVIPQPPNLS